MFDEFYHFDLMRSELFNRLFALFGRNCINGRNKFIKDSKFTIGIWVFKGDKNVANLYFDCELDVLIFYMSSGGSFDRVEFSIYSPSFFDDVVNLCIELMSD